MLRAGSGMAVLVVVALSQAASASWAYTPTVVLVAEADYVVVGKIVRIEADKELNAQRLELAVVKVSEQLKGDTAAEVKITYDLRVPGGPVHSAMIVRAVGDEGVWILKKEPGKDYCDTRYPLVFRPLAEREKVAAVVKDLGLLPFGEAVNGLAAASGAFEGEFFVWLKNVGTEPLLCNTYVGDKPLRLRAKDLKAGQETDRDLYAWLERVRMGPRQKSDFRSVAPGRMALVRGNPIQLTGLLPAGEWELTVSYVNEQDGQEFDLKGVWKGRVAARPLRAAIAAPPAPGPRP